MLKRGPLENLPLKRTNGLSSEATVRALTRKRAKLNIPVLHEFGAFILFNLRLINFVIFAFLAEREKTRKWREAWGREETDLRGERRLWSMVEIIHVAVVYLWACFVWCLVRVSCWIFFGKQVIILKQTQMTSRLS